ncbi:MAG: protein-L-isoaspartate(D-aspartate) O-methyltransferase [Marinilabiliaceae bacterium]
MKRSFQNPVHTDARSLAGIFVTTIFLIFLFFVPMENMNAQEYKEEREEMVQSQIRAKGVKDGKVLEAMRTVPRHLFVPEKMASLAYSDRPLAIGHEQTISQPFIVAFMTEALDFDKGDKVLEIGSGSGYQAAVLAEMGAEVWTIEIVPELAEMAENNLKEAGYENVHVKCGDGYKGWPEEAPFDAVIITAAPESIPDALVEQLREGGNMVLPVGPVNSVQTLKKVKKKDGKLKQETLIPVRFVPMVRPSS